MDTGHVEFEEIPPNPEDLIKSIAEQGYSLEAALADLVDNCISAAAQHVEILIDTDQEPYTLYLADDGNGMSEDLLKSAMRFPSSSPDGKRDDNDLGRFGLGMKTASFSQTRRFSVISRKRGTKKYAGRTWDVDLLKDGKWLLAVNDKQSIDSILSNYRKLSDGFLNSFNGFEPSTIVVWRGMYKFENYLSSTHRKTALKKEITEITSDYLSLVFHRFMERRVSPLKIRINNARLTEFNPFPIQEKDVRPIEFRERSFGSDSIKVEGFVLPSRAVAESVQAAGTWTTKRMSLMDMEGVYIYRVDRIISFGDWIGMTRKGPRLQLARLRVEIGNKVDHLLHLNVAKSQIQIPHDLRLGFEAYVEDLKTEAEREYYNRGLKRGTRKKAELYELFQYRPSTKGLLLEMNQDFPVLQELLREITPTQKSKLNILFRLLVTKINSIRKTQVQENYVQVDDDEGQRMESDLKIAIKSLLDAGVGRAQIKSKLLPELGYSTDSIPNEVISLLDNEE